MSSYMNMNCKKRFNVHFYSEKKIVYLYIILYGYSSQIVQTPMIGAVGTFHIYLRLKKKWNLKNTNNDPNVPRFMKVD